MQIYIRVGTIFGIVFMFGGLIADSAAVVLFGSFLLLLVLQDLVSTLKSRGLSTATINRKMASLSKMLQVAVDLEMISDKPKSRAVSAFLNTSAATGNCSARRWKRWVCRVLGPGSRTRWTRHSKSSRRSACR